MNKDENISEEQLNAFVDGELESEERNCLFDEAEKSTELDQRLCQQRKLKELLKHAYREVPEPAELSTIRRLPGSVFELAMVASIILVLGVVSGVFLHSFLARDSLPGVFSTAGNLQPVTTAQNYIIHVASGDPEQMGLALQKAKTLLASAEPGVPRRVEVVANEQGLDLLRSDVTKFSNEISYLASEKVIFYACSKTIHGLQEQGVVVKLVPEAIPGYTALDRVVIRMKDGWQYIKI